VSFCEKHGIEIPDLNDCHSTTRFRCSHLEEYHVTIEQYFKVDLFFTIIGKQLQELNNRFSEQSRDLLTLYCSFSIIQELCFILIGKLVRLLVPSQLLTI